MMVTMMNLRKVRLQVYLRMVLYIFTQESRHHWKITLLQNYVKALPLENSEQASQLARLGLTHLWFYCAKQQKVEFEDMAPEKLEAIVKSSLDPNDIWNAYIKAQLIEETDNGIRVLTEELLESLN